MEYTLSRGKRFLLRSSTSASSSTTSALSSSAQNRGTNDVHERRPTKRRRSGKALKRTVPTMADGVGGDGIDLFGMLPDDALCNVMKFLDAPSLLRMRLLNRSFNTVASKNSAGWDNLCSTLWRDKAHVARSAKDVVGTDAMAAYRISVMDAKERDYLTVEELCYDPVSHTGSVWSFRFKEAAGRDWTSWDPWFHYQPCRKMVLLEDGTVKMYLAGRTTGEAVTATATATATLASSQQGRGQRPQRLRQASIGGDDHLGAIRGEDGPAMPQLRNPIFQGGNLVGEDVDAHVDTHLLVDPPSPMRWRLLTQPLDFPARPLGSYIRFSVAGREVPTYSCRRSLTNNWGFVMESCWGVYASFELPPRPRPSHRRLRRRLRRVHDLEGNEVHIQVDVDDDDDDDDDEHDDFRNENGEDDNRVDGSGHGNNGRNNERLLIDDDSFAVTSGVQWREAFLYNFGARVLPEGDDALAEFERVYGMAFD